NTERHRRWWSPRETHSSFSVIRDRAAGGTGPGEFGSLAEVAAASFCCCRSCAEMCSRKKASRNGYREERCNRIDNPRVRWRSSYRNFPERLESLFHV